MPTQFGNHYKAKPFRIKGEFNCISQKNIRQVDYYAKTPFLNSPYFQLLDQHRSRKTVLPGRQQSFLNKIKNRILNWV